MQKKHVLYNVFFSQGTTDSKQKAMVQSRAKVVYLKTHSFKIKFASTHKWGICIGISFTFSSSLCAQILTADESHGNMKRQYSYKGSHAGANYITLR
jgi:hypothetical protein